MRSGRLDQLEPGRLVLAVKFEPAVLGTPHRVALGIPRQRVSLMVERLRRIELLEFERLGVSEPEPHAIAEGVEREGLKQVVVVRHAPGIARATDRFLCGPSHFAITHPAARPGVLNLEFRNIHEAVRSLASALVAVELAGQLRPHPLF